MQSTASAKPLILIYDCSWGLKIFPLQDDRPYCEMTANLDRLPEANVVMIHVPTAPDMRRITKYSGQIWVAFSMESIPNYPLQNNLEFMQRFDLTMTYRLDSDIPLVYFGAGLAQTITAVPEPKTASAPAVFFASNANDKCERIDYVRELMGHMPVHSYGKCLNNRQLGSDEGPQSKFRIISSYKFTLAFENSLARDYVTEKFFEPLRAGSVPVYRGAPNIAAFAPAERSFIDVTRFSSPRELAEYLLFLDRNEAEYQSYMEWKRQPLSPGFLALVEQVSGDRLSRLCSKLRNHNGVWVSEHVQRDPIHKILRWRMARLAQKA